MIRRSLNEATREALAGSVREQGVCVVAVAVQVSPTTVRTALRGHRLQALTACAFESYATAHPAPEARAA